jgi:DNA polymerase alpha subunit B
VCCHRLSRYVAGIAASNPDPSLTPVQVVNSVLVINPGTLSKRRAAGTYAQMAVHTRTVAEEERPQKQLSHKLYERARVDINRI